MIAAGGDVVSLYRNPGEGRKLNECGIEIVGRRHKCSSTSLTDDCAIRFKDITNKDASGRIIASAI